jgi:excisionase family DNA binding protein
VNRPDREPPADGPARPRLPLLSVSEVARQLGVCGATVYALCAKGALKHVRVLNAIRVAQGDLEAFVERRV